MASWNDLIELASDLLPGTSDGAAEVLHYLSCRSLNESFSFIPDVRFSLAQAFIFSEVISTGLSHRRRAGFTMIGVCRGGKIRAEKAGPSLENCSKSRGQRARSRELSFLIPYHVTLMRVADLRGCNWSVSGVSGRGVEQEIFSSCPAVHPSRWCLPCPDQACHT